MIPPFTSENVLPHMLPDPVAAQHGPWHCTAVELVDRFGTTPTRRRFLLAWLDFRRDLLAAGFVGAFQWIDGSFVEAQPSEPHDIDVLTFLSSAQFGDDDEAFEAAVARMPWFDEPIAKQQFGLQARMVDFHRKDSRHLVAEVCTWTMLFSHRRGGEPKGWLQIVVDSPQADAEARQRLIELNEEAK